MVIHHRFSLINKYVHPPESSMDKKSEKSESKRSKSGQRSREFNGRMVNIEQILRAQSRGGASSHT